ncbi:LysR family transcriptional regulator [Mesorhizobium koreense]|uniref:LysR family transcriptional regulator n=1 Tax=Mesorhizobium koreense TaxID=3074855 RepID=UPI00287B9194|nr:LysR family transcriptional regulator [Mesorhizobium sp. WR6]
MRRETLDDQLTPRTLRLIAAIGKHGHLSRAAEELHIVPSAASRRIRKLEDVLGATVINRQANGLTLTRVGMAIAAHAERRADDLDVLQTDIGRLKGGSAIDLKLAVSGPVLFGELPEQLQAYLRTNPNVHLSVVEQTSDSIAQSLLSGDADMGIVLGSHDYPSLHFSLYRVDRLGAVVPPDHRLSRRTVLYLDDLAEEPLIVPRDSVISDLLQSIASQHGVQLRHGIDVSDFASICRVVEGGLGITVMPASTSASEITKRGLVCIPLDYDWARCDIYIATKSGTESRIALSELKHALLQ